MAPSAVRVVADIPGSPFTPDNPSFDAISATIRLGHKYQITHLVDHSISYLRRYYTDDFDTWNRNETFNPPGFETYHAIGVVNLARLTGELAMLPAALVACCKLYANIVDGLDREDGTHEQLSSDDLGRCFVAKGVLVQDAFENALLVVRPPVSATCTSTSQCRKRLYHLLNVVAETTDVIAKKGPLRSFVKTIWGPKDKDTVLCAHCWAMLNERDLNQRLSLWNNLPMVLDLPDSDLPVTATESGEDAESSE